MVTTGLVLAAGAGRRFGGPKALEPGWLEHAVEALRSGGCDGVRVVIGADAERVRAQVPGGVEVTVAEDWADGMGASLRAGLQDVLASARRARAVVVHLVDLPDVGADVVARVVEAGGGPDALVRASYASRPGHPVLIGRNHWGDVIATASGDSGARDYLRTQHPRLVECGDLATGIDVDEPTPGQPVAE